MDNLFLRDKMEVILSGIMAGISNIIFCVLFVFAPICVTIHYNTRIVTIVDKEKTYHKEISFFVTQSEELLCKGVASYTEACISELRSNYEENCTGADSYAYEQDPGRVVGSIKENGIDIPLREPPLIERDICAGRSTRIEHNIKLMTPCGVGYIAFDCLKLESELRDSLPLLIHQGGYDEKKLQHTVSENNVSNNDEETHEAICYFGVLGECRDA